MIGTINRAWQERW